MTATGACVYTGRAVHTHVCPIKLRCTHLLCMRPGAMEGRWATLQYNKHIQIKRTVPNLDAIQSSGPGTWISSTWIHLVDSWSDVTGRTPPTPTATCHAAVPSCWGLPYLTLRIPAYPPTCPPKPPEGTPPKLAGVHSSLDPWRALGSSLPCHAAMQGPLQRRDWNRLR